VAFHFRNPRYAEHGLLDRLVEPERLIQFRVSWIDDRGDVQVNRGYRIQHIGGSARSRAACASTRR